MNNNIGHWECDHRRTNTHVTNHWNMWLASNKYYTRHNARFTPINLFSKIEWDFFTRLAPSTCWMIEPERPARENYYRNRVCVIRECVGCAFRARSAYCHITNE